MLSAENLGTTYASPQKRGSSTREEPARRSSSRKNREFAILGKSYPDSNTRQSNGQHRSKARNIDRVMAPKTPKLSSPYMDASSDNSPVSVMDEMLWLRKPERIVDAFPSDSNDTKAKRAHPIHQYRVDDSDIEDDSSHEEEFDALKDLSMILEECFGSSLSDESKYNNSSNGKSSCSNPKNYRAQLEQSKQVIQMLFKDLKVSKQNETLLSNKLRASHVALRQERNRSRENTRIAMRSADEVRANLASRGDPCEKKTAVLPPYSAAAEVERLKKELQQAREECLKWKQKAHYANRLPLPQAQAPVHALESESYMYAPTDEERVVTPRKKDKSRSSLGQPSTATPRKKPEQQQQHTPIQKANIDSPPVMVVCTPKAIEKTRSRKKSATTVTAKQPRTPKLKTDSNLMQELLASKDRLKSAEAKLHKLVNTPELFDSRRLATRCDDEPSIVQDQEVAIQLVKTFDEAVEVSHKHLHTFDSKRLG